MHPTPDASIRADLVSAKVSKKRTPAIFTPEQMAQARASQAANREKRRAALASHTETYATLRNRYPEHQSKINNLSKGSLKAAVALMCIDCSCGQTAEIRGCTAKGCPLWPVRPYRGKP